MKIIKLTYLVVLILISSCGFEDNLPCKASECEINKPEVPNTDNEG